MNLQQQSLSDSCAHFSLPSAQFLCERRPRFQRKKSNSKCQCSSTSKNHSSCDNLSLSNLYVKKSFLKHSTPSKNHQNDIFSTSMVTTSIDFCESGQKSLGSTRILIKNDSQQKVQKLNLKAEETQVLIQGFLNNSQSSEENKKQTQALLKKTLFYKEKCSKYQNLLKDIRTEKHSLEIQTKMNMQEIESLKSQILRLMSIIDDQMNEDGEINNGNKKIGNKNLLKLKQEYQRFREQQKCFNKEYERMYKQKCRQVQQIKQQNIMLRQDIAKQNELFNMKIRMMEQKQAFMQKTLSYTKNTVSQLQRDYQERECQVLETKRLRQIINQKNKEIQGVKSRYEKILKMINGQKKMINRQKRKEQTTYSSTSRTQKQIDQRLLIPMNTGRSRHSLQIKSMVYEGKNNNKEDVDSTRLVKNGQRMSKVMDKEKGVRRREGMVEKENNNMMEEMKNKGRVKNGGIIEDGDMTLVSLNSLELSPEKSQN